MTLLHMAENFFLDRTVKNADGTASPTNVNEDFFDFTWIRIGLVF